MTDDCRCGHPPHDHLLQENNETWCAAQDCYCGRNPLEWAPVVPCSWCSTSDPVVRCLTKNNKILLVEPEPDPAGNCEIKWGGSGMPLVIVHGSPPGMFDDWTPYMPHIATCDKKLRPTHRTNR